MRVNKNIRIFGIKFIEIFSAPGSAIQTIEHASKRTK